MNRKLAWIQLFGLHRKLTVKGRWSDSPRKWVTLYRLFRLISWALVSVVAFWFGNSLSQKCFLKYRDKNERIDFLLQSRKHTTVAFSCCCADVIRMIISFNVQPLAVDRSMLRSENPKSLARFKSTSENRFSKSICSSGEIGRSSERILKPNESKFSQNR